MRREALRATSPPARVWLAFDRLTGVGFPRGFPVVQFPNLPLMIGLLTGAATGLVGGTGHTYLTSVSYLALAIWAYDELAHGVNWFRRLLGLTFVILLVVRVAHAIG